MHSKGTHVHTSSNYEWDTDMNGRIRVYRVDAPDNWASADL